MEKSAALCDELPRRVAPRHEVDAAGQVWSAGRLRCSWVLVFFRSLPPCLVLVGVEVCATGRSSGARACGAWARGERQAQNDAADAEALDASCAGEGRRSPSRLMLHRADHLPVRRRTMLVNSLRAPWQSSASLLPKVSNIRGFVPCERAICFERRVHCRGEATVRSCEIRQSRGGFAPIIRSAIFQTLLE